MGRAVLLATLPGHLVYDLAAAAYCAATGRLGAFVRGKLSALRHPVRVARKRRDIQRRRRATLRHLWRMMDRRWVALKWREKRYDLQAARSR